MDPDKSVVFVYDGVPAHLDLPSASPSTSFNGLKFRPNLFEFLLFN